MSILILDTCVLVKLKGNKTTTKSVNTLLERHGSLTTYISEMTFYEYLRASPNKTELLKSKAIISKFPLIPVDTDLIKYSTAYHIVLMNTVNSTKRRTINIGQLSDSDIIIGASAIRSNSFLCTTDRGDFPSPFFDEVDYEKLGNSEEKIYMLKTDTGLYDRKAKAILESFK